MLEVLMAVGAFAVLYVLLHMAYWLFDTGVWDATRVFALYLRYVVRHKTFVYLEGRKLGIARGQLLVHDFSKLSRAEFWAYAVHFYSRTPHSSRRKDPAFEAAFRHHVAKNKHHWEYWTVGTGRKRVGLPIPDRYLREMAADWRAMARGFDQDPADWYSKNRRKIVLERNSRDRVESLIGFSRDAAVPESSTTT